MGGWCSAWACGVALTDVAGPDGAGTSGGLRAGQPVVVLARSDDDAWRLVAPWSDASGTVAPDAPVILAPASAILVDEEKPQPAAAAAASAPQLTRQRSSGGATAAAASEDGGDDDAGGNADHAGIGHDGEDDADDDGGVGAVDAKVDRAMRGWRRNLRATLAGCDPTTTDRLVNQLSQMSEWRHAKAAAVAEGGGEAADAAVAAKQPPHGAASAPSSTAAGGGESSSSARIVSTVTESMLQLLEATSSAPHSARSGGVSSQQAQPLAAALAAAAAAPSRLVTAPRNTRDEPAWEVNTALTDLLQLHVASEARLARGGTAVPSCASSSLTQAVAQGLHGGPGISNDRAGDVSGLAAVAKGRDTAAAGGGMPFYLPPLVAPRGPGLLSPLEQVAVALAVAAARNAGAAGGGVAGAGTLVPFRRSTSTRAPALALARLLGGSLGAGDSFHGGLQPQSQQASPAQPFLASAAAALLRGASLRRGNSLSLATPTAPSSVNGLPFLLSGTAAGGAGGPAARVPNPHTVQLLVEVDVARCLSEFGQPGDLYVSVYDGLSHTTVTDEARVFVDSRGFPAPLPRPAAAATGSGGGSGDTAANPTPARVMAVGVPSPGCAQTLFLSLPRALLASGRAYLVFRLYRLGPLKESAAAQAMSSPQVASVLGSATFTTASNVGPVTPSGAGGAFSPAPGGGLPPMSRKRPVMTASEAAAGLDSDSDDDGAGGGALAADHADAAAGAEESAAIAAKIMTPAAAAAQKSAAGAGGSGTPLGGPGVGGLHAMAGGMAAAAAVPPTATTALAAIGAAPSSSTAAASSSSSSSSSLSKTASAAAREAFSSGLRFLMRRKRTDTAVYSRLVGVGITPIPAVLPDLADGTPHRPEPVQLLRPYGKLEEPRFFGLHRTLIAERERDLEQAGRRATGAGALATAAVGSGSAIGIGGLAMTVEMVGHDTRGTAAAAGNAPIVVDGGQQSAGGSGASAVGGGPMAAYTFGATAAAIGNSGFGVLYTHGGINAVSAGVGATKNVTTTAVGSIMAPGVVAMGGNIAASPTSGMAASASVDVARLAPKGATGAIIRTPRTHGLPVVLRCASSTHVPTVTDARYAHLLGAWTRTGLAVRPAAWAWRPPAVLTIANGPAAAGGGGGAAGGGAAGGGAGVVTIAAPATPGGVGGAEVPAAGGAAAGAGGSPSKRPASQFPSGGAGSGAGGPGAQLLPDDSSAAVSRARGSSASGPDSLGLSTPAGGAGSVGAGGSITRQGSWGPGGFSGISGAGLTPGGSGGAGGGLGSGGTSGGGGGGGGDAAIVQQLSSLPVVLASPSLHGLPLGFAGTSALGLPADALLPGGSSGGSASGSGALAASGPTPLAPLRRDELYVTIRRGSFHQDAKIAPRNVQVRVNVVTDRGAVLPCLHRGVPMDHGRLLPPGAAGTAGSAAPAPMSALCPGVPEYRSAVYYHCNAPVYEERLAVCIPSSDQFAASHLLFTFWHASSQETRTHVFAFAVLPLAAPDGTPLRDGRHSLRVYRAIDGLEAGITNPWYLVAPLVDASGREVLGHAPPPHPSDGARGAATGARSNSGRLAGSLATGGGGGAAAASSAAGSTPTPLSASAALLALGVDAAGRPLVSPAHAASARLRHLPLTAQPMPLSGPTDSSTSASSSSLALPLSARRDSGNRGLATSAASSTAAPKARKPRVSVEAPAVGAGGLAPVAEEDDDEEDDGGHDENDDGEEGGSESDGDREAGRDRASDAGGENGPGGAGAVPAPPPPPPTQAALAPPVPRLSVSAAFIVGASMRSLPGDGGPPGAPGAASSASLSSLASSSSRSLSSTSSSGSAAASTTGATAAGAHAAEQPSPWPPLEIRGKDVFEVETRLVSDVRSSVPELNALSQWRALPVERVSHALAHLPKLTAEPPRALRSMPLLLTSLTDLIASLPPPPLRAVAPGGGAGGSDVADTLTLALSSPSSGGGSPAVHSPPAGSHHRHGHHGHRHGAATVDASPLGAASPTVGGGDARQQKLLSAALRVLAIVADRFFAPVRPAERAAGAFSAAPGGGTMMMMPPSAVDASGGPKLDRFATRASMALASFSVATGASSGGASFATDAGSGGGSFAAIGAPASAGAPAGGSGPVRTASSADIIFSQFQQATSPVPASSGSGSSGPSLEDAAWLLPPSWPPTVAAQRLPRMAPPPGPEYRHLLSWDVFSQHLLASPALHATLLPCLLAAVEGAASAPLEAAASSSATQQPALHAGGSSSRLSMSGLSDAGVHTSAIGADGGDGPGGGGAGGGGLLLPSAPGSKFALHARTVLQLLRSLSLFVRLAVRSFGQQLALTAAAAAAASSSSSSDAGPASPSSSAAQRLWEEHTAQARRLCASLLTLLRRPLAASPAWVLAAKAAALRQLPSVCAELCHAIPPVDLARVLAAGLQSVPLASWMRTGHAVAAALPSPLSPLGGDDGPSAPADSLGVCQLLAARDIVRLGFLSSGALLAAVSPATAVIDGSSGSGTSSVEILLPPLTQLLLAHMNAGGTSRALCLHIAAGLVPVATSAAAAAAPPPPPSVTAGWPADVRPPAELQQPLSLGVWCCGLLLGELSRAVGDVLTGRPAPGDVIKHRRALAAAVASAAAAAGAGTSGDAELDDIIGGAVAAASGAGGAGPRGGVDSAASVASAAAVAASLSSWRWRSPEVKALQKAYAAAGLPWPRVGAISTMAIARPLGATPVDSSSLGAVDVTAEAYEDGSASVPPLLPTDSSGSVRPQSSFRTTVSSSRMGGPVPAHVLAAMGPALAAAARRRAALRELELDCTALPPDVYFEVYGPAGGAPGAVGVSLVAGVSGDGGGAAAGGAGTGPGGVGGDFLSPDSPPTPAAVAAHAEGTLRSAVTALLAVVAALPEGLGPYLLATLAPVRHTLPPAVFAPLLASPESPLPVPLPPALVEVHRAHRLALGLRLLRTSLALLSHPPFPPPWVAMGQASHSAVLRTYRWVGGLLGACYSGTGDDAAAAAATADAAPATPVAAATPSTQSTFNWRAAMPLWSAFCDVTVALLTSPLMSPEALPAGRRAVVLARWGDRRPAVCRIFRQVWGGALALDAAATAAEAAPPLHPGRRSRTASTASGTTSGLPPHQQQQYGGGARGFADVTAVPVLTPAAYDDVAGGDAAGFFAAPSAASGCGGADPLPGMCAPLKLALAPLLVGPSLDLTHCACPPVAELARDLYMDLIRSELTVRYGGQQAGADGAASAVAPLDSVGSGAAAAAPLTSQPSMRVSTTSSPGTAPASALSAAGKPEAAAPGGAGGLPTIERHTIDAIAVLVQVGGPSLVVPATTTATVVANAVAAMAAAKSAAGGSPLAPARPGQASFSAVSAAVAASLVAGSPLQGPAGSARPLSPNTPPSPAGAPGSALAGGGDDGSDGHHPQSTSSLGRASRVAALSFSPSGGGSGGGSGGLASLFASAASRASASLYGADSMSAATAAASDVGGSTVLPSRRPVLSATRPHLYVPSPDNMIMSLFAPSTAAAASSGGSGAADGAAAAAESDGGSTAVVPSSGAGATGPHSGRYATLLRHPVVARFLSEIRTLYAMLSALGQYPPLREYEDERAAAAETLISYLRRSHRPDLYTKYVAFLTDLHAGAGNAAEAAMAYLLHADPLDWSPTPLPPAAVVAGGGKGGAGGVTPLFPAQTSAQRLETVLSTAAEQLASAGALEEAVRLHQLLAARYEHATVQYAKLAASLRAAARLFDDIHSRPRLYPAYFVVALNGSAAWPTPDLRGSLAVYRGGPGERITEFEERLAAKWPGVKKKPLRHWGRAAVAAASATAAPAPSAPTPDDATSAVVSPGSAAGAVTVAAAVPPEFSFSAVQVVPFVPRHPLYDARPLPPGELASPAAVDGQSAAVAAAAAVAANVPAPPAPVAGVDTTAAASAGVAIIASPKHPPPAAAAVAAAAGAVGSSRSSLGLQAAPAAAAATGGGIAGGGLMRPSSAFGGSSWAASSSSALPPHHAGARHPVALLTSPVTLTSPAVAPIDRPPSTGTAPAPAGATAADGAAAPAAQPPNLLSVATTAASAAANGSGARGIVAVAPTVGAALHVAALASPLAAAAAVAAAVSSAAAAAAAVAAPVPTAAADGALALPAAPTPTASGVSVGGGAIVPAAAAPSPASLVAAAVPSYPAPLAPLLTAPVNPLAAQLGLGYLPPGIGGVASTASLPVPADGIDGAGGGGGGGGGDDGGTPTAAAHHHSVRVPSLVRQGRANAGARVFLLQRPFRVRPKKSGNEFLDTWVARVYFVTADAFPTTHRRSPVVGVHAVSLNPLEAAGLALAEKNESLRDAIERAQAAEDGRADDGFSSLLQGVVDAAVSGGVANYRPFLTGDYVASHPEIAEDLAATAAAAAAGGDGAGATAVSGPPAAVELLRRALSTQLAILRRGIAVHAVKCAPGMRPLHEFLVERYATLLEGMAALGVPLPPPADGDE